ncbi:MAG: TetR/AcrR family transcriptional regulator [Acetobacteraceae bacterium]
MARPRAADHDDKRRLILERSAELFAAHGYDRASLSMLARACGMSKALFYHYYAEKSEVLFDIIRTHLEHLLAVTANLDGPVEASNPRLYLLRLTAALLEAYRSADAKHHVQISQLHLLPRVQQELIKDMQRQLVDRFAAAIAACLPPKAKDHALLKPITMSLFAMLNWNYLWFREHGPLSRNDYARLAVTLLVEGARSIPVDPAPEGRRSPLYAIPSAAIP